MLEKISHFYLSRKTFLVAIIATMILGPIGKIMQARLNALIPFEWLSFFVLYCLLIGLFITHHKQDYILMNGIVSGILIYEFVHNVYLITYYTGEEALMYLQNAGFFIYFGYAFIIMAIAGVCLITYNHFTINRSHAVNRTKIILNQFLLLFLFFASIVLAIDEYMLGDSLYEIVAYTGTGFSDAFLLLVVACCELELAVNRKDETTLEELNLFDVKAALWYAFSCLFGLLCFILAILLPGIKAVFLTLSGINFLLSLGLLIYYLNKKKKPSSKRKICLCAGFITTVALTIASAGYFIWTIVS